MDKRTKVLVTNDDGIMSVGIRRLVAALGAYADVYVAAPAEDRSAAGHGISADAKMRVSETGMFGAREAYELSGTPVDCVIWAVGKYLEEGISFDYVFSGINLGSSAGSAAYYSGTIGAAREGALRGIRSVALSVDSHKAKNFDYICGLIPRLMEMSASLTPSTILNVNSPDIPAWEINGARLAEIAPWGYCEKYSFEEKEPELFSFRADRTDPPGAKGPAMRYDLDCMANGYVAISPVTIRIADEPAMNRLAGLFPKEDWLTVFVDVQEQNVSGVVGAERLTGSITNFARCISRLDMPALILEQYGLGETIPEIRVTCSGAETVVRREFGAWGSGDFARLMAKTPYRKVMIAGTETHASVLRTALEFAQRGYEVTVIEDCCSSRGGHDHKVAIEAMRDAGCRITTYRAMISELLYTTEHPAAEALRRALLD